MSPEKQKSSAAKIVEKKVSGTSDPSTPLIKVLKVTGAEGNKSNKLLKNRVGSDLSLLQDSSIDESNKMESSANVISAVQKKNIIAPIPEEKPTAYVDGKDDGDDSSSTREQLKPIVESNRRPLEELNQTLTLIKKVEATKEQQSAV